jgi:hypothetical protein
VAALVWIATLAVARYVSFASVLAALTLAGVRLYTTREPFSGGEGTLTGFALLAAALVIVRHRSNLSRLSRGEENRITDSTRLRMLARVLHIFALSLWFGAGLFFTFGVALSLFHTFEGLEGQRPSWLPLSAELTKEQGTRLAGIAVGPIFPQYFALQGTCGLVALITAWGWTRTHPERVHRIRFGIIAAAMALLLVAWPVVGKVDALRIARYDSTDKAGAQAAFNLWHTISLLLNFAVLGLVAWATALLARLPDDRPPAAG